MAQDLEQLVLSISADTKQIQRALKKLEGDTGASTRRIEKQFDGLGRKINGSLVGLGKNAFAGFAAGATAALAPIELINVALRAIDDASHLVELADKVGLSTTALQELSFGFSQAGVEAGTFDTSMEQFTKRMGEAATKGGMLADILKANGVAIRDSNGQIRSTEDLLRDYAELVRNAASEQEKLLLVTEAFGRGGVDMVTALNDGAAGLDKMKKAAAEAGGTIDEEVLRRAEEIGDRFDAAWRRFKTSSTEAILGAIVGIDDLKNSLADYFDEYEKRKKIAEAGALVGSLAGQVPDDKEDRLTGPDARISEAFAGEVQKADEALVEALRKRYAEAADKATIIPSSNDDDGKKTKERADEYERLSQRIVDSTAATVAETEAQRLLNPLVEDYGYAAEKARLERELLTAAEKAGKEITPQLRSEIAALSEQYALAGVESAKLAESQDDLRERMEDIRDLGKDVTRGFVDDLINGTSAAESFANALGKIGDKLLDLAFDDLFSGGGLLGSLFGGGFPAAPSGGLFSEGGYTGSGGKNQAAGVVHKGEYVFSKDAVQHAGVGNLEALHRSLKGYADGGAVAMPTLPALRPRAAAGQGMHVTVGVEVDNNGNLQAYVKNVARQESASTTALGLDRFSRQVLPGRVREIKSDPRAVG